jgi:hypothetical protein
MGRSFEEKVVVPERYKDTRYKIRDTRYGIQDMGYKIWDTV